MNVNVQLEGTILAPQSRHEYHSDMKWITFEDLDNFHLQGGGQFNGRGQEFWACRKDDKCDRAPTVSNYSSFSRPSNLIPGFIGHSLLVLSAYFTSDRDNFLFVESQMKTR